jgi:hypothetical protein
VSRQYDDGGIDVYRQIRSSINPAIILALISRIGLRCTRINRPAAGRVSDRDPSRQ